MNNNKNSKIITYFFLLKTRTDLWEGLAASVLAKQLSEPEGLCHGQEGLDVQQIADFAVLRAAGHSGTSLAESRVHSLHGVLRERRCFWFFGF